jgi:hypothetical protein
MHLHALTKAPTRRACLLAVVLSLAMTTGATAQGARDLTPFPVDRNDYDTYRNLRVTSIANVDLNDGTVVDLDLYEFRVLAEDAVIVVVDEAGNRVPMEHPDVRLYQGKVAGQPDSRAFLSLSSTAVQGFVQLGDVTYIISDGGIADLPPVAFNPATMSEHFAAPTVFCGVEEGGIEQLEGFALPIDGGIQTGNPPRRCVSLAIDTDYEYYHEVFNDNGVAALNYLITLWGATSLIYAEFWGNQGFNVELDVNNIVLWSANNDPWNSPSACAQKGAFTQWYNNNMQHVDRHAAHLVSGRNLGGGCASVASLCNSSAYGVEGSITGWFPYPLENRHSGNWDLMVVAHELGHNFGSGHTHCYNPPIDHCYNQEGGCYGGPENCSDGTLMSYCHACGGMDNILLGFHWRVIDTVLAYLATRDDHCDWLCPANVKWLDFQYPPGNYEHGTFAWPYRTLGTAVNATPVGGTLMIKDGGSGPLNTTITKALTMQAYNGPVTIGQ